MTAAGKLQGLTLDGGWKVITPVERPPSATGGMFSHGYWAKNNGNWAFVKAFDFSKAFEDTANTLSILHSFTASYEHERDILEHCQKKRLSHVAVAIGHGSINVPDMGAMEGRVYYLLFERADSDVRCQMDTDIASDEIWCMYALRQTTLGLWQVHREFIAHQDLKPSNVLCFEGKIFRVSDFGRSSRRGQAIWHDDEDFPGDRTYAPLELLYGHVDQDFVPRRIGTDLYMLGNLATFLFTGTNVTESILTYIDMQHHWKKWCGTYAEVLPYLQEAFARFLETLESQLSEGHIRSAILPMVRELCNPNLDRRGHPKSLGKRNQYSLERYVSQLTNTIRRLEIETAPRRT